MNKTNTPGFRKARSKGNRYAYDVADSLDAALAAYSRCRTSQSFILSDEGIEGHSCDGCGEPLTVKRGNRCEYDPRTRKVTMHHYECAWGATMNLLLQTF